MLKILGPKNRLISCTISTLLENCNVILVPLAGLLPAPRPACRRDAALRILQSTMRMHRSCPSGLQPNAECGQQDHYLPGSRLNTGWCYPLLVCLLSPHAKYGVTPSLSRGST